MTLSMDNRKDAPTNPKIVSTDFTGSDDRIFSAIMPDDSGSITIEIFGGSATSNDNLANTKGFRL